MSGRFAKAYLAQKVGELTRLKEEVEFTSVFVNRVNRNLEVTLELSDAELRSYNQFEITQKDPVYIKLRTIMRDATGDPNFDLDEFYEKYARAINFRRMKEKTYNYIFTSSPEDIVKDFKNKVFY